tara:strand:- start:578 stop:880 length:303 start_codon:yes stop_codon:yes gene_type:complete
MPVTGKNEQEQQDDIERDPPWKLVHSSTVSAIRYWPKNKWLDVRFYKITTGQTAGTYRYYNVPLQEWEDFKDTPSYGQYVWYQLRQGSAEGSKYMFEKLS